MHRNVEQAAKLNQKKQASAYSLRCFKLLCVVKTIHAFLWNQEWNIVVHMLNPLPDLIFNVLILDNTEEGPSLLG